MQMSQKWDRKIVLTLNARNEHDRSKFVEDLRESVAEMDEMEALRLEAGNLIKTVLFVILESILPNFVYQCSRFMLLSLSVCNKWKKCIYSKMA